VAYLEEEYKAAVRGEVAYMDALLELQASCDHKTILKFTDSNYTTFRVCEDCGYNESAMWDSPYKYKDQRLCQRAYDVSRAEFYSATPRLRLRDVLYHLSQCEGSPIEDYHKKPPEGQKCEFEGCDSPGELYLAPIKSWSCSIHALAYP
jgi:hypothetical protein